MNAPELSALRRLLFFSAPEAARWIARDAQRPEGVDERTWNRWEAGKMPVPANIAAAVQRLLDARHKRLQDLWQADTGRKRFAPAPRLLWYAEADDWPGPPVLWRVEQSALAAFIIGVDPELPRPQLVAFDAVAYQRWRAAAGLPESPETRQAWADAAPVATAPGPAGAFPLA